MAQKIKVIISTRECDNLGEQYIPFKSTIDVYQTLIKVHSNVLTNKKLQQFLLSLTWHDVENKKDKPIFTACDNINISMFECNGHFKNWLLLKDNQDKFLKKLCDTYDKHLIRRNNDESEDIYVTPLIHDDFSIDNVNYIEVLLKSLKKKGDTVYLLLHDKDLFKDKTRCYQVKACDVFGYIEPDSYPYLTKLVVDGQVFVYTHEAGLDVCYDDIVCKLKDGITQNEIVDKLNIIFQKLR